jgi:regulator of ribonuclease activity B
MSWVVLLLYAIPALLLVYWLLRRRYRPAPLPDATAQALSALRRRGADLSKPTTVRYLLSFETREAAETAARDLPRTWAIEIKELPDQHRWACQTAIRMLPVPAELSTQAQELEAIAMRHGGEYEGWEAEV